MTKCCGLHVHRAERTDILADALGAVLASPLSDPFAAELVVVPTRGVERWLSQRLSHVVGCGDGTDGVCAGVVFSSPVSFMAQIAGTSDDDPWSAEAMTWPLLEVIDTSLDESWCVPVARHLGHFATGEERDLLRGRRYAVARRLAGLFASYARERPELLMKWSDGCDDGLDDDVRWQPSLWRALVDLRSMDPPHVRHAKTLARLHQSGADLPPRLSLFGYTRLPRADRELLGVLAKHHDVHMWLPHPSAELWAQLVELRGPVRRREDTSHRQVGHPLLATLGRDLRELQRCLPDELSTDEWCSAAAISPPQTLLGWLQSDIAANAVRPEGRLLSDDDRSVQVHSCHGPARQVDVLREVLLGVLADDPTLQPRDIVVMCPDIETYAALIVADFGLGDVVAGAHPAHQLRVHLADRSLVHTNPLLGIVDTLLNLANSRVTATEVLDLAHSAAVRLRFGFTDDGLERITRWVQQANIRWGFDQQHRTPYGVDWIQNTWRFGIDRVLAGVALSDDSQQWLGVTLPLDDVGSNDVELAGRLAEYCDRLQRVVDSLSHAKSLNDWMTAIIDGVTMLASVDADDAWQVSQLHRECSDIVAGSGQWADTVLELSDIRAVFDGRLAGRPTRANFRTGTLTVCTMLPMRSVPHRVVCLMGLDDTVFPRTSVVDGDDVLRRDPMTGERDIRAQDRQLFLDAICSAREKLIITYTGTNELTGHQRPPAVPLMELLDSLDMTTSAPVRQRICIQHPLQPFDIRNVTPGELGVRELPFTFDPTALVAAQVASGQVMRRRQERDIHRFGPLPQSEVKDVTFVDVMKFFSDPVKGFFTALDLALPWERDDLDDAMPVEIDGLGQWMVGQRMLTDMLAGKDADWALQAEWRRGCLPPGRLGWRKAQQICSQVVHLARAVSIQRSSSPQAHDIDLDLGHRRLTGTVASVGDDRLVDVTYSVLDGPHLLRAWLNVVALAAQYPDRCWTAVCIGRARSSGSSRRSEHSEHSEVVRQRILVAGGADAADNARDVIGQLVDIYDAGRREPLPLPIKTSFAWAQARYESGTGRRADPLRAASMPWRYERQSPAIERVWGRDAQLDELLVPVRPGEEVAGETTRLGSYAARLWLPLLRAERGGV